MWFSYGQNDFPAKFCKPHERRIFYPIFTKLGIHNYRPRIGSTFELCESNRSGMTFHQNFILKS